MSIFKRAHRRSYEPPIFDVVALGPAGSGKTVFLSSLFHQLNYQSGDRAYHLETDAEQRIALASVHRDVSDTSCDWPDSTNGTREFAFDCVAVDGDGHRHTMLRVRCLDFAGELLHSRQEAGSTALADLTARIGRAHALLGMIDGARVLELLRGEPAGLQYRDATLQPMVGLMQETSCPIHLVLTKWDLVRDFGEPAGADDATRLQLAIDALTASPQIDALARHRRGNQIVRLIPVSSVGTGFAELGTDGRVVKRPGGGGAPDERRGPVLRHPARPVRAGAPALEQAQRSDLDAAKRRELLTDTRALLASLGLAIRMPTLMAIRAGLAPTPDWSAAR